MHYTIRNVSPELDQALKARAKKLGKSVNQVVLEALAESVGQTPKRRNLRNMPGAWSNKEAAEFERHLERDRRIDEELWK